MQLSEHFSYEELTRSPTAIRLGIDNTPNENQMRNLVLLCNYVLEPLRDILGVPIYVNSGYRCPALNAAIGSNPSSQHMLGQAADIDVIQFTPRHIIQILFDSYITVDQAIEEFGEWTHVSWRTNPRNQYMTAQKTNGETHYRVYP